jgi:hypothetical protein
MNQSDQRTKGSDRSETTDAKVMAYDKLQLITIFGLIVSDTKHFRVTITIYSQTSFTCI